jgi:Co/Zn/Cd efflux system component
LFNGIFLVFISYNILCESVERIFEPIKIEDDGLITVSVLGLIVNGIGLVFFHEFHHHGEECSHGHSHAPVHAHDHSHETVNTNDDEESSTPCDHHHEEPH